MQTRASEILISSHEVGHDLTSSYEFVLDTTLQVLECAKIESRIRGVIRPIKHFACLEGLLFELNHVRVNPQLDNDFIIEQLTNALIKVDVTIKDKPRKDSVAVCYRPLGEISDCVRFYLNKEGRVIFLSPSMRPKLIYARPS